MGVVNKSIKEGTSTRTYRNLGNYRVEIFSWPKPAFLDSHKQINKQKVCARNFCGLRQPRKNILKFPELRMT